MINNFYLNMRDISFIIISSFYTHKFTVFFHHFLPLNSLLAVIEFESGKIGGSFLCCRLFLLLSHTLFSGHLYQVLTCWHFTSFSLYLLLIKIFNFSFTISSLVSRLWGRHKFCIISVLIFIY